jgi:homoserine dehydrogenase
MEPVKIGLLGLGTVGGGTVTVLTRNAGEIERRAGRGIEIARAAAREYRAESIAGIERIGQIGDDAFAVVEDPEIQVVVELIGGYSPAKELVLRAIALGKHVVTANKALIARHGNEIFAAARDQGVMVGFEAAVAGGIPIIKAVREGLAANHIEWIAGIINGTGNFILTEMRDKGRDFADVLQEAQQRGYAEADPTFDVEGIDAAISSPSWARWPSASRCSSSAAIRRGSPGSRPRTWPTRRSWATGSSIWASHGAAPRASSCGCTRP